MKTLLALAAALTATALTAPLAPVASSAAADTVDLSHPRTIERGDDIRLPHLRGTTVVDGDVRVEVPNAMALLGPSGDDYVVLTRNDRSRYRVKRVTADGSATVLLRGKEALYTELSEDGEYLLRNGNERRTLITAYDATDGTEVASRRFRSYAQILEADAGTVLVTTWQPRERTVEWDIAAGTTSVVVDRVGSQADISADRLSYYTGDPYAGGCLRVVALSAPDTVLWESCRQRVYAFSPDGDRFATVHLLADGVGPGEVQLRETDGTLLVKYTATWFNQVYWEDADTLLLEANGRRKGATVRCDGTDCERATKVKAVSP